MAGKGTEHSEEGQLHVHLPTSIWFISNFYTSKQTRRDWLFGGRWNGSDGGVVVFLMVVCVCAGFSVCMNCNVVTQLKLFSYSTIAAASSYYDS